MRLPAIVQLANGARVELVPMKFTSRIAAWLDANRPTVNTDAAWDTVVNGMTDAQVLAAMRVMLKAIVKLYPVGELPRE